MFAAQYHVMTQMTKVQWHITTIGGTMDGHMISYYYRALFLCLSNASIQRYQLKGIML
jgi:hypothetical protein